MNKQVLRILEKPYFSILKNIILTTQNPRFPTGPPSPQSFLGGHYIGKNNFLQNGKINVFFLCVLML